MKAMVRALPHAETPFDMHLPNRHGLTAWDYVMFKKETDKEIVDVVKMHIAKMTKLNNQYQCVLVSDPEIEQKKVFNSTL